MCLSALTLRERKKTKTQSYINADQRYCFPNTIIQAASFIHPSVVENINLIYVSVTELKYSKCFVGNCWYVKTNVHFNLTWMFGFQSCLGLDFPDLGPRFRSWLHLVSGLVQTQSFRHGRSLPSALARSGRQRRTSRRPGVGRRAGRSSCPAEAAVTRDTPGCAGGRPEKQVAEGKPSGPEQIGLTLPTPPPSSPPRLPLRCQRALEEEAPRLGGRDAPGPGMSPAREEAPSGPAPDLSPRLTPEPTAATAGAACGCPCGWAGSGRSGEDASAGGRPWRLRVGWRETAELGRGAEPGKGVRRSGWLPAVRDRESLRTQVSPQPQQHKMADTSPRTSRDSVPAPSRPLLRPRPASPPYPLFQPPTTSFLSAAFRPYSPDTPLPEPRMPGWERAGPQQGAGAYGCLGWGSLPALELSRVCVQSWSLARRPVTHRPMHPIQIPFAVQKALHQLRADLQH